MDHSARRRLDADQSVRLAPSGGRGSAPKWPLTRSCTTQEAWQGVRQNGGRPVNSHMPSASFAPMDAPADPSAGIAKTSDEAGRITPMMEQYIEIKAANPDCLLFYRMGDFYELFFDDAEVASRALGIMLTKRGKHLGRDIPMCGVPIERADEYLHRLIALGHRVAVCEQLENPAEARKRGAKSVVRRDVVRLVTPGTLTEDSLLDARRNNYLLAIARSRASSTARPLCAVLDRYFDRRIPRRRMRPRRPCRRDRAYRAGRDHCFRRALRRRRTCTLSALAAGGNAAHPRRVRRRDRRTSSRIVPRRGDDGFVRRVLARRARRGGRGRHLCRAHPDRQASAAVAAAARSCRCNARDRSGDAQQSRTHAHARRRAARLAPCRDRPHA